MPLSCSFLGLYFGSSLRSTFSTTRICLNRSWSCFTPHLALFCLLQTLLEEMFYSSLIFLTPLPGLTAPQQDLWPVSSRSVEAGTGSRHQPTPRSRHLPGTQQINVEEMKFQRWSENNACLAQTSQNALGRQRNTYPLSNLPTGALASLKFSPGASYGPEAKTPYSQCRRPRLIP